MKQIYRYLPFGDEVLNDALCVIAAGSAQLPPGTEYPPATHPQHHQFQWDGGRILKEYQLIYIPQGGGRLETRTGGPHPVRAGDLFVLFPGEWHRYSPDPAIGWSEHWAAFQGKDAAEIIAEHAVTLENPLLHTGAGESLLREFTRIEEEIAEEAIGFQRVTAARLRLILALAAAAHQNRSLPATDILDIIKRAKRLLADQIDRPVEMEQLAADLQVGYSWLRKMFRRYTGVPPAQYQMQLRVTHACALLQNTTLPVAEIGSRCGFESAYYFARVFRSKTGCTPSEYRNRSRTLGAA